MKNPQPGRIPSIDGLRGVAVLLVMAYHFDIGLPGGFIGVDFFFTISGFVVTRRLLHEFSLPTNSGASKSLKDFYVGRFWRLFPALAVMIVSVVVASQFMEPVLGDPKRNVAHGLAALVGMSNWFRLLRPDLPGEIARPLLHTWSLSIEEQFYLCLPLLLAVFRRKARVAALGIGGFCIAASLLPLPSSDPSERYFFTLGRLAPLGFGVLLAAFLHRRIESVSPGRSATPNGSIEVPERRRTLKAVDGVFVVLGILLLPTLRRSNWNDSSLFPLGLILIGLLSAGILGLLTLDRATPLGPLPLDDGLSNPHLPQQPQQPQQTQRVDASRLVPSPDSTGLVSSALESKLLHYFGTRSYSLYLWHFPIAHLFMSQPRSLRTVAWVVLSFLAAELSYRFVECPLRFRNRRRPG
jgi:peptidoglycan/LPS O-acetylase OafA/YrhL